MAGPSLTYTLTNATTADASQVMQNFNDILNGITDGTKDISVSALTVAGIATLNGNVTLGNSSSDDLTVTASLASSIALKAANSYDIGANAAGLKHIYLGSADSALRSTKLLGSTIASAYNFTLPAAVGTIGQVLADSDGASTTVYQSPVSGTVGTSHVGLAAATTTNANDSIKIFGHAGSALSASRPIYHGIADSSTAGQIVNLTSTANVTILVSGAHWGLDGLGDFTNVVIRVYKINDTGAIKYGLAIKGGMRTIASASTSATQSDINTRAEMLVNTALNSGTWPCQEIGWFQANFTDSTNVWAVQTSAGNIGVGIPAPRLSGTYTPAANGAGLGTVTSATGYYEQIGNHYLVRGKFTVGTSAASEARITLPTNVVTENTDLIPTIMTCGNFAVGGSGAVAPVMLMEPSKGYLTFGFQGASDASLGKLNGSAIGTGAVVAFNALIPCVGISANEN